MDAGGQVSSSQNGTVNITTTTDSLTVLDTEVLDTASAAATVASMTSLGNTTAADATLAISGTMGLTVTGNVISAAQANFTITVDDGHTGNYLKIGGNVTAAANEPIDINLEGANSAYLEFNGADQTIGATVLSDGGKDGLMKITGSGTKTFSAAVGATLELGSITTAANTTAVFSAAADTVAVTNAGTIQFDGATIATTIANTGTVAINNATAGVTGSTTVTMTGASTVLNMNGQASKSQTMVVVAATDAHGTKFS
jgi:hypothetical protein